MDDDEYYKMATRSDTSGWSYHEICKWLPYKPETIDEIAQNMAAKGYRQDRPVVIFEGSILDGRHRYEAAIKANVDPIFVEFQGTREEAIDYVTSENVARRHLSNPEKEFFYIQRAEALGVRNREDSLKQNSTDPTNVGTAPSAKEHADALGVSDRTVERWEEVRKEIKADPKLAEKAKTFDGYNEAKKEVRNRKKEAIKNTVAPDVIDLNAIARDKKDTDIRSIGPAFIALMEKLCTKFAEDDIKRELVAFMHPDPLGLKTQALHKMSDILNDIREDFIIETPTQKFN